MTKASKPCCRRSSISALWLALLLITLWPTSTLANESLKHFQWKHRLILVDNRNSDEKLFTYLSDNQALLNERDIVWIVIETSTIRSNVEHLDSNQLRKNIVQRYFKNTDTKAVLIGKDGSVKGNFVGLELHKIFALIDTMPMRQFEMRERDREN